MNKEVMNQSGEGDLNKQEEYACPTCGHRLVPVWTLPEEKLKHLQDVEIREQFYCKPCNSRYAIEEIWTHGEDEAKGKNIYQDIDVGF